MKVIDIIKGDRPSLSFEVFPPKTTDSFSGVMASAAGIASLHPDYMSVTYGAGGSTAGFTAEIAAEIKKLAADYTKAIAWGNEKGIVMGYTSGANKGKFKPNDPCTRGQVVLFLWRYAGKPAVSGALTFKDADEIGKMAADYSKAILWANAKKITTGYSDNTFRPNRNCTRGECVTFLYRM